MNCRLQAPLHVPVLGNVAQEAVHALLPEVLCDVPVRPAGSLRQQTKMRLLQQLEDQRRPPKMPLINYLHSTLY